MKKNTHFKVRKMVVTALCAALGIVLPLVFHGVPNAGVVFLPMHIPILLCGILCGASYGLLCGFFTPLLSSILTGMPPAALLPVMICELTVYGYVAGLVSKFRFKKPILSIYMALIAAMIAGRVTYGVCNSLLFRAGDYSMQLWLTTAFITSFPGILIQLILIPILVLALRRAKVLSFDESVICN